MRPPASACSLNPYTAGEPALGGEGHDLGSLRTEHRVPQDEDATRALAAHRGERRIDLGRGARFQDLKLNPEGAGRVLCLSQRDGVKTRARVLEKSHPGDLGGNPFEHLQLLSHQLRRYGG
jgi:hypothetical protein